MTPSPSRSPRKRARPSRESNISPTTFTAVPDSEDDILAQLRVLGYSQRLHEPAPKRDEGDQSLSIVEMMRLAEREAARLDGREVDESEDEVGEDAFPEEEDDVDELDSEEEEGTTREKRLTNRQLRAKRPKISYGRLLAMVEQQKERAVEGGKRMKWGDESEVSDGEYLKSEEAEREEDHETDELVCGTKEEETAEEDGSDEDSDESEDQVVKMLSPQASPPKTPATMLATLRLSSSKPVAPSFASAQSLARTPDTSPIKSGKPNFVTVSDVNRTPSPRKPSTLASPSQPRRDSSPSSTPTDPLLSTLTIPPYLQPTSLSLSSGARLLRLRTLWIQSTSLSLSATSSLPTTETTKTLLNHLGRSTEWYRQSLSFLNLEKALQPSIRSSPFFARFAPDGTGPDPPLWEYFAFVQHWRLCGTDHSPSSSLHEDEEGSCRWHEALKRFYGDRGGMEGRKGKRKMPLPREWSLESERARKEWEGFAGFWE